MVVPIRNGNQNLIQLYENTILNSPHLSVFNMDSLVAKKTAEIRANYNIKTPDAIQLATAILHKADYFLSNDKKLKRVTEVKVITLDEL